MIYYLYIKFNSHCALFIQINEFQKMYRKLKSFYLFVMDISINLKEILPG